jgi:halimadienyl-diphosphate synthase
MACNGYVNDLVESAFDWIVHTQNPDGSWGYYMPTAEETAYCLQALAICQRTGRSAPKDVIRRGAIWLADHQADPFPPLWIDKCLYCPDVVVRSAILTALWLTG